MSPIFDFDAATVVDKGQRSYQEDAIITDFARGADMGFAVLADGMGGHAAGDIASKIVVSEVFSELLFQRCDAIAFEKNAPEVLKKAAQAANSCLKEHVQNYPETRGMGATLIATVILNRNLYWISIGDSPLFLFRDGELTQLNEDHSMAPQFDFMAQSGLMDLEEAENHPDRNALTSVLFGAEIPKIDCPPEPLLLHKDDMLIVSSDGLQSLNNARIREILQRQSHENSAAIVDGLLNGVLGLGDPNLDNVSFSVIKVCEGTVRRQCRSSVSQQTAGFRCVG